MNYLFSSFLCLLAFCLTRGSGEGSVPRRDPRPVDAVTGVLGAFDRHRIVAVGEVHGLMEEHRLLARLIGHPDFPGKVGVIVVEFGSATHQAVLDRYLTGGEVPRCELQRVWRDTSQAAAWDSPLYAEFFDNVRQVNARLSPSMKLRVLLGDPGLNWSRVRNREDYNRERPMGRTPFMVSLLADQAFNVRRKALWIAGTAHVRRRLAQEGGIESLERRFPGSTLVIMPHVGLTDSSPAAQARFERLFSRWPRPSAAWLRGTTLGAISWRGRKLEDEADCYLYLGPSSTLTYSRPPASAMQDKEMNRRFRILNGPSGRE